MEWCWQTMAENVCLRQWIPFDVVGILWLVEGKACPQNDLGKTASCGLKICFWETGVPVRVRPRPPSAFRRRRASSFHWPDGREADACLTDKLAGHKPRHPRHVEFGILASARQDITGVDSRPRCSRSHTPSLETDWVGKSHRAPTPGPDTFVAWHSCSCR
jgi:hypothetical protein